MFRVLLRPSVLVSLVLLAVSAVGLHAAVSSLKLYLRKLPIQAMYTTRSVSTETESWRQVGADRIESAEVVSELGTENYLSRVYEEKNPPSGRPARRVELHLAYYTGMIDTVPHVPERCIVGGGWTISGGTTVLPLELKRDLWIPSGEKDGDTELFTVRLGATSRAPGTRVRLPRGIEDARIRITDFAKPGSNLRLHAGYFFIANGGVTDSADGVRLLAFDLKDDYAYYLKVQVSSNDVKTAQELAFAAASLVEELLPDIMLTVPDWLSVQRGEYPADNPRRPGAKAEGAKN